jgi:hypothetical protein
MWPKPGQSQPSQKWTYVKAVKIDESRGTWLPASIHNSLKRPTDIEPQNLSSLFVIPAKEGVTQSRFSA